jgi:hypothetical protein
MHHKKNNIKWFNNINNIMNNNMSHSGPIIKWYHNMN